MRTRPRTEGGLHGILHERVKYAANQFVQIIKAYGERAQRNLAVIEALPLSHHQGGFSCVPNGIGPKPAYSIRRHSLLWSGLKARTCGLVGGDGPNMRRTKIK
jgi:hypothetical protein